MNDKITFNTNIIIERKKRLGISEAINELISYHLSRPVSDKVIHYFKLEMMELFKNHGLQDLQVEVQWSIDNPHNVAINGIREIDKFALEAIINKK